jgi:O-antigen/teichoic acid export membrane protein
LTPTDSLPQHDISFKSLIRYSSVIYSAGFISILLTTVQQLTTAGLLGAGDYGRLAAVVSSSAFIMLLIDVRTWELGAKFLARPILDRDHSEISQMVSWLILLDLVTGLVGAAILIIFAQPIAEHLLKSTSFTAYIRLYALTMPFQLIGLGVLRTVIRLYEYFNWLAVKSVIYAGFRLILLSGIALFGFGFTGVLSGVVFSEILNTLVMIWMVKRIYLKEIPDAKLIDFTKPRQFDAVRRMIGDLWLGATLKGIQLETFIPIMALLTNPTQVGIVRTGIDLSGLVIRLTDPIMIVLMPMIMKSAEQDSRTKFIGLLKKGTGFVASLVLPFMGALLGLSYVGIPRLLGSDFAGVDEIVVILLLGSGFNVLFLWLRPAIVALDCIRSQNILSIILTGLSMMGMFILIPSHEAIGGAMILSSYRVLIVVGSLWIFYRGLKAHQFVSASENLADGT